MNSAEVLESLEGNDAIRRGHFELSSGLHSDLYVQCAVVLQWPRLAERLARELASRVAPYRPTAVLGPAMGGIVIGHEVARQLGVRMVFAERVNGQMTLRRGFMLALGEPTVVIEDVITTGRSQQEALELVRGLDADPVAIGSIVDRSGGATFDVPGVSLLSVSADQWEPQSCPLCREGDEPMAPGSRRLPG